MEIFGGVKMSRIETVRSKSYPYIAPANYLLKIFKLTPVSTVDLNLNDQKNLVSFPFLKLYFSRTLPWLFLNFLTLSRFYVSRILDEAKAMYGVNSLWLRSKMELEK